VVGLAAFVWPDIINPAKHRHQSEGMATCMVGAFSLCCVLGLRYPLAMLPVLLWEVIWKTLWLALVPLPQFLAGHVDDALKPSIFACGMVVLVYLAIPWGYVFAHYIVAPGAIWWRRRAPPTVTGLA